MQEKLKVAFKDYVRVTGSYKTLIVVLFISLAFERPDFFIAPVFYVFLVVALTLPPLPFSYTITFISVILVCFIIIRAILLYRRIKKEYLAFKLSKEMSTKNKVIFVTKSIYGNLKQLSIYAASLLVTGHMLLLVILIVKAV